MRRRSPSVRSPTPMLRANALMPAARYGVREEMKQAYGFGWREHVRGVTTTLDVVENLSFHEQHHGAAGQARHSRTGPRSTPASRSTRPRRARRRRPKMPDVIVAAANAQGRDRALFRGRRDGLLLRLAGRRAAPTTGHYDAGARRRA